MEGTFEKLLDKKKRPCIDVCSRILPEDYDSYFSKTIKNLFVEQEKFIKKLEYIGRSRNKIQN